MRWAILELLEEAEAAVASITSTPAASRVRAGKCVYMCSLSHGQKAGEVLVSGGDDASDARRTMQPGDVVVVSRVETSSSSSSSGGGGNDRSSSSSGGNYGTSNGASSSTSSFNGASSSSSSSRTLRVEAEVKVASPLVLEPVGDKARGAQLLTSSSGQGQCLWRVDKLANAVQFERALTALRIVASAAAAGANRQDTLARTTAAAAAAGRGGGVGQRGDAVRGLVKEANERLGSTHK